MVKKRIIPCLFLQNGFLVRSEKFSIHQSIGNAVHQVERFNDWAVDELIYIDISRDDSYDLNRDDMKIKSSEGILAVLEAVSRTCFMPLTFGGGIRSIDDIYQRVRRGADKVTVNTMALRDPSFVKEASNVFGSQCIIVSIDFIRSPDGKAIVVTEHGKVETDLELVQWAREVAASGAGEIFLNAVDRDGTGAGYDLEAISSVTEAVNIPVIACGGVGNFIQMGEGITKANADAVSAGNIFHFTELSAMRARKQLVKMGVDVRQ